MSRNSAIDSILCGWREAERRLDLAIGRDAEVIEREVAYYRALYTSLSAARTDAATALLHEDEGHRARYFGRTSAFGVGSD